MLLLTAPFNLQAAEDVPDLFELSMEEILLNVEIISAAKKPEKLLETPGAVYTLTASDIRLLNFNTLEECMEYVTGISSVNGEGNVFTTTTIRGNTLVNYNTNTLLLFDGIPVYSPYHGSFDFGMVPLSSIERVEIIKGANSVLYGTNAINSVINVISRRAAYPEESIVTAEGRYGTHGTLHGGAALATNKGDVEYALFVDSTETDGEEFTIRDEKNNVLDYRNSLDLQTFVGKFRYKNIKLHGQFFNRQLPNYRTRGFTHRQENDERGMLFNIDYSHPLADKYNIRLRSNYYDWTLRKTYYPAFTDADKVYYWDYEGFLWSTDLELYFRPSDRNSNILGFNYSLSNARRYKSEKDAFDIGKHNEKTMDWAVYLNGDYKLLDSLNVVYGGRYYISSYHDASGAKDVSTDNFSKRAGLVYKINNDLYVKALYGEAFRVPTYFEKEVDSAKVKGNPNLAPELSISYDLVVSAILGSARLDVNAYSMRIEDKITRVPLADGSGQKQNQNIGTVRFTGLEANLRFHFGKDIQGFTGYAYCKGKNDDMGEDLKFTYENMVNFVVSARFLNHFTFTGSAKYLDDWGEADAYTVLNAGLVFKPERNSNIEFDLKIDNIFNEEINLPEIARNVPKVPTIPKTSERRLFMGVRYQY